MVKGEISIKLLLNYNIITLGLFFPVVIFFSYWVIFNGDFTFHHVYFIWYLILFILFFIGYYLLAKSLHFKKYTINESLLFSFIPFILIPISIPISNELQFALSGIWNISPRLLSSSIILLLFISSLTLFFIFLNRGLSIKSSKLIGNIYFPVFVATTYLFKSHINFVGFGETFDLLHVGQEIFPVQQLLIFNKIPYVDFWPGRGLTDILFQLFYSAVNGYRGLEVIIGREIYLLTGIILTYIIINKLTGPLFSLLTVTILPLIVMGIGGRYEYVIYFVSIFIPTLCLSWTLSKPGFFRFGIFWVSVLFIALWMPSLSKGVIFAAIFVLSGYHLLNKETSWRKSFFSFILINGFAILIYTLLVVLKNKSLLDNLILIKSMATTNGLIGSYSSFFGEFSFLVVFQYFILPAIGLIYIIMFIIKIFKQQRLQKSHYMLVFLSVFSLVYFQRGFERHCLLEEYNPYLFVFLGFSLPLLSRLKKSHSQSIFLLSFLLYFYFFPDFSTIIKNGRLFEFKEWKNKESRVVAINNKYKDLSQFLSRHLTDDQTFFEFMNAPLLYPLTEREFPLLYHSAQIYFSEPPQIVYIKNLKALYEDNKIPFVIFNDDTWWGRAIDGIPPEFSAYRIAEFIYRYYKPLTYINTSQIWIANNFHFHSDSDREKGENGEDGGANERIYARLNLKDEIKLHDAKRIDKEKVIIDCGEYDPYLHDFIALDNLGQLDIGKNLFLKLNYKSSINGNLVVGFMFNNTPQDRASVSIAQLEKTKAGEFKKVLIPTKISDQNKRTLTDIRFDPPNNSIFEVSGVEIVEKPEGSISPLHYIQQDFNLMKLPYVWGTYDLKKASTKTIILSTIAGSGGIIDPNNPLELNFNPDIDKSSGNYLHFRLKSKSKADITISYGKLINSIKFETVPSDKFEDYLIRISSQWEWMSEPVNSLIIKSSAPVEIEKILIRKGD